MKKAKVHPNRKEEHMNAVDVNYQKWVSSSKVTAEEKRLLEAMDPKQKDDAFFQDIQFGTGGMRGILGPGTNRMNSFTVKRATIALGEMVLKQYPNAKKQGIVISHDNRHHSRDYAEECAQILNEMGINAYLFDSLRPTPELSYGVRYVKAVGGIMDEYFNHPSPEQLATIEDSIKDFVAVREMIYAINFPDGLPLDSKILRDRLAERRFKKQ